MFVAIDTIQETAVTGPNVRRETHPQAIRADGGAAYRCLCCDAPLTYNGEAGTGLFGYFTHSNDHGPCVSDGGMSMPHRLGEEVIAKTLFNLFSTRYELTQIDLERRIGASEDFVIADVRVTEPIRLAIEVVYLSSDLDLRRRFRTLFRQDYSGMIIVVSNGKLSQTQIERHLSKVGTIRVGRFDPQTVALELGSVVTPDQIDLETPVWNRVPAYVS
jgi:hypothetical protein